VSEQAASRPALAWRVLGAWADLRGSMRAELDQAPGEPKLLAWVMLSGLIWFLGRVVVLKLGPIAPTLDPDYVVMRIGAEFVGSMFFRTLAFYGVAALAGATAMKAGGTGSWRESRAAMFWAALVAAPVMLAGTLLSVLLADAPAEVRLIARMIGALAFAWAAAQCIAEAHGFARVWLVLAAVFVAVGAFVTGLALLVAAL